MHFGLGCSLLKHDLDINKIVALVSNRDTVLFLLMVSGKFVAYFILLNLASIISSVHDTHSESDEESKLLLGLTESWWSLLSSVSDFEPLNVGICPVISLTWSLELCVLWTCLSGLSELLWGTQGFISLVWFVVFVWLSEVPGHFSGNF